MLKNSDSLQSQLQQKKDHFLPIFGLGPYTYIQNHYTCIYIYVRGKEIPYLCKEDTVEN